MKLFKLLIILIFCISCGRNSITSEMIEKDIIGKSIDGLFGWTFAEDESRTLIILEEGYGENKPFYSWDNY